MHPYTRAITRLFVPHADPVAAVPMKRYMRGQFDYLGIKLPEMYALLKDFYSEHGLPPLANLGPILRDLWDLPQREYQYAGSELLGRFHSQLPAGFISTLEYLLTTRSWWDTVDTVATGPVGIHFKRFPGVRRKYLGVGACRITSGFAAPPFSFSCTTNRKPISRSCATSSARTLARKSSSSTRPSVGRCGSIVAWMRKRSACLWLLRRSIRSALGKH